MKRARFAVALGAMVVLALSLAHGEEGRERSNVKPHRFLVLTSQGPLVLDLEIYTDKRTLGAERDRIVRGMIARSDGDQSGATTWQEAVDGNQFAVGRLKHLARSKPKSFRRRLNLFDENEDGNVDFSEAKRLWTLYTEAGELVTMPFYPFSPLPTAKAPLLFTCLDSDNDGVLSEDEVLACHERMLAQDANDDESLSTSEVLRFAKSTRQPASTASSRFATLIHPVNDETEFSVLLGGVQSYLSAGPPPQTRPALYRRFIQQLDKNDDGELDLDELAAIANLPADLEVVVHLGDHNLIRSCQLQSLSPQLGSTKQAVAKGNALSLRMDTLHFRIAVSRIAMEASIADQVKAMFSRLDRNRDRSLQLAELEENTDVPYAGKFANWDADNDGNVRLQELTAYYEEQETIQRDAISIFSQASGHSLWGWLDTDGDLQLSLREMNAAKKRIESCDRNGDKRISFDEVPRTFSLRLIQRSATISSQRRLYGFPWQLGAAPVGPNWFVRMDRNGDGDVSLREFLGTKSQFASYDTDSDGLIDADEAQAGADTPF